MWFSEYYTESEKQKVVWAQHGHRCIICFPLWSRCWPGAAATAQDHRSISGPGKDQNPKFKVVWMKEARKKRIYWMILLIGSKKKRSKLKLNTRQQKQSYFYTGSWLGCRKFLGAIFGVRFSWVLVIWTCSLGKKFLERSISGLYIFLMCLSLKKYF